MSEKPQEIPESGKKSKMPRSGLGKLLSRITAALVALVLSRDAASEPVRKLDSRMTGATLEYLHQKEAPEWSEAEIKLAAKVYSKLCGTYINPDFFVYTEDQGDEKEAYQALTLAIEYPGLLWYDVKKPNTGNPAEDEKQTIITIKPRGETGVIPADFRIVIQGGIANGAVTRIVLNGKNIRVKPEAYSQWQQHAREIYAGILDDEERSFAPEKAKPESREFMEKYRGYERILPRLIARLHAIWERNGYLDPVTDDPTDLANSRLRDFLERAQKQGTGHEGSIEMITNIDPDHPDVLEFVNRIDAGAAELDPIAAFSTDGRYLLPVEEIVPGAPAGTTRVTGYAMPEAGHLEQLILKRLREELDMEE